MRGVGEQLEFDGSGGGFMRETERIRERFGLNNFRREGDREVASFDGIHTRTNTNGETDEEAQPKERTSRLVELALPRQISYEREIYDRKNDWVVAELRCENHS